MNLRIYDDDGKDSKGAVVVDVTGGDGGGSGIEAVAFVNPDNSVVVVIILFIIFDHHRSHDYRHH